MKGTCEKLSFFSFWDLGDEREGGNLGLANGDYKVGVKDLIAEVEANSVHKLVLEDNHWVGIANGGLDQTPRVFGRVGGHHLGNMKK